MHVNMYSSLFFSPLTAFIFPRYLCWEIPVEIDYLDPNKFWTSFFFVLQPPHLWLLYFILRVCNTLPILSALSHFPLPFSSIRFNMVIKAGNYIISRITTAPVRHDEDNRACKKLLREELKWNCPGSFCKESSLKFRVLPDDVSVATKDSVVSSQRFTIISEVNLWINIPRGSFR